LCAPPSCGSNPIDEPTRLLRRASWIANSTSPYVGNVANVAVELLLEGDCCTRMGDRYIHSAVEARTARLTSATSNRRSSAIRPRPSGIRSPSPIAKLPKVKFYDTIVENGRTFAINEAADPRSAVFLKPG
jgi:hypothetical protein